MRVLEFRDLEEGIFVERPNRFTGRIKIGGKDTFIHIRDSGRLGELLSRGARVLVRKKESGKLGYELISVYREGYGWVFTNSGYHSLIAETLIERGVVPEFVDVLGYGKEIKVGGSRIDFALAYRDRVIPLEIKGCTLFEGEICFFPDAPTQRGRKHLITLQQRVPSALAFLVFSEKVRYVSVNHGRDPGFAAEMVRSLNRGVHVWGFTFGFDGRLLEWKGRVPFVYPVEEDTLFLYEALVEASRIYNDRYSPESNVLPTAVWTDKHIQFNVLFGGYICESCGLFDYFDDFSITAQEVGVLSEARRYSEFGNTYLVTYRLEGIER